MGRWQSGHSKDVTAKIGQHLSRADKWRLGIDHPVDATRRFKGSIDGDRIGQIGMVLCMFRIIRMGQR
jgi:hypothetical protein